MKTLTEARVEPRTPAKKDRILLWLLLATTPAKDHDLDTPDHEPNDKKLHQKGQNHPIDEVVHEPGVQKKPDRQQSSNETEDILRSVEKVIQVIWLLSSQFSKNFVNSIFIIHPQTIFVKHMHNPTHFCTFLLI